MKNLMVIMSVCLFMVVELTQVSDKVKKSQMRKTSHRSKMRNKHKSKDIFFSNVDAVRSRNELRMRKTGGVINVLKKSQQFIDDQANESAEGEQIYQKNKAGRDDRIPEDEMIVAEG